MNTHEMKLATEPFEAIKSGNKVIESRLYDAKRQMIGLGDTILFINREVPDHSVQTKVVAIYRYPTFSDMFHDLDPQKFGGESVEWLDNQINEFYTLQDQQANGVVGFKISII